jgi:sterol desaturase/sphingolipid hydroxylase (fatty acid hydroxylase superfamily)
VRGLCYAAAVTVVGIVAAVALVMFAIERVRPGRLWPRVEGWWARACALNAMQIGSVYLAGVAWDGWLLRHRPYESGLSATVGGLVGYLAITFVFYFWHRARHRSSLLWRLFHQVHHSPQRIEVITSFYKHPAEIVVNALLSSVVLYLGCGLGPEAASNAVLLSGLAELVYHWNVATPYWLGFLFQRPESHCVHHQEGHHTGNFADLPLWDMLFGTFQNPRTWNARCGFGEREHSLPAMLATLDVDRAAAQDERS